MFIVKCKKTVLGIIFLALIIGGLSCSKREQKNKENTKKEQEMLKIPDIPPKLLLIQYGEKINAWDLGLDYWENSIPAGKGHKFSFGEEGTKIGLYSKSYPDSLKKYLGIDMQIIPPSELIEGMSVISEDEAAEVADKWIREAEAVVEVEKEDIIKVAKMYLSIKKLLEKYNANAWTLITREQNVLNITEMPPLAEMQSYLDGIPACCEGMVDALVTQMTGTYISGRPGFIGDRLSNYLFKLKPEFEQPRDVVIFGHCYMPINPHGKDRVPYIIRSHQYGMTRGKDGIILPYPTGKIQGAPFVSLLTHWPIGETVTITKFNVWEKVVSVFTGEIVAGDFYFRDFEETACRDKLVVKVDNYKDCENSKDCYLFPVTEGGKGFRHMGKWGYHDAVFCGDYKEEILKLAKLIGFDVTTAEGVIKNPNRELKDSLSIAKIISKHIN